MAFGMSESQTASQPKDQQPENLTLNMCIGNCCICSTVKRSLNECELLKAQTPDIKVHLLKANSICFGCLTKGHISKTCKRRMTC